MEIYNIEGKQETQKIVILDVTMPKFKVNLSTSDEIAIVAPRDIYDAWCSIISNSNEQLPDMGCSWNIREGILVIDCDSNDHILQLQEIPNGLNIKLIHELRKTVSYEVQQRSAEDQKKTVRRISPKPVNIIDKKGE